MKIFRKGILKRFFLFLALLISFIIYAFYRTEHTVISVILKYCLSGAFYHQLRSFFSSFSLPNIIVFSFPQGLWVFSATLISREIFLQIWEIKIDLSYLPIIFSVTLELLQLLNFTNGTFDTYDLCFALLFWLTGLYLFKRIDFNKVIVNKGLNTRTIYLIGIYCIVYLSDIV